MLYRGGPKKDDNKQNSWPLPQSNDRYIGTTELVQHFRFEGEFPSQGFAISSEIPILLIKVTAVAQPECLSTVQLSELWPPTPSPQASVAPLTTHVGGHTRVRGGINSDDWTDTVVLYTLIP